MKESTQDLKNKRLLVLVESPNKCSHISEYLKAAGYKKAVVLASVGHISSLKDNRASYKNSGIYPDEDFRLNIALSDDKKAVVKQLKEQADVADYVFIMTDGDREGEAIGWSLVKFLKLKEGKYFRAITHEITPKAVVYAIEHPIELNENVISAAHARMALDKLVGYALSPVAKAYIGAKSVGRCQSAGLKLVCDRENEINHFVPETYYDLYLNFSKDNKEYQAKYAGTDESPVTHLSTAAQVKFVKNACNGDYIIKNIVRKEKQESPKPPFCTATFQQEAASKLGLKVKDAMSIAQKLFENGYITYMRTDDQTLSDEFVQELKAFITTSYGDVFTTPRQGKNGEAAQAGHEALRITNPSLTPDKATSVIVNDLQCKVYKLIWQRTIACAMPNAVISETTYNIYNNDHKFVLTSSEVLSKGYRKIFEYGENNESSEKVANGTFVENEILDDCSLDSQTKQTQPPARYKEASLVKELQKLEIGRPSTFATIVETVLSDTRGYCKLEDKYIVPTQRGMQLSAFLDRAFPNLINLNYTKEMEADLDLIASGDLEYLAFLQAFFTTLEESVNANTETGQRQPEKTCPKCGSAMKIKRSRFGKLFYGCSQYPNCNGIVNVD